MEGKSCWVCKKTFTTKEISMACKVNHLDDGCCHYGQDEIKQFQPIKEIGRMDGTIPWEDMTCQQRDGVLLAKLNQLTREHNKKL